MFAFSTSTWNGDTGVYRRDGPESRRAAYRKRLETIWSPDHRKDISKGCHNARFDCGMTMAELPMPLSEMRKHDVHESMALSHLFNNRHRGHKLEDLAWEMAKFPRDLDEKVKKYKSMPGAMMNCPEWLCDKYQRADAVRETLVFRGLSKKVREMGLWDIYEMERQLIWTTMAVEARGMHLDFKQAEKLIEWLRTEADKAQEEFQAIAGKRMPLNNNTVRRVLFKTLKFPVNKWTETDLPCVDKYVLKDLKALTGHPIFDPIMRYRSYGSGVTTIRNYIGFADSDGMIHPNIHPYRADTSRQACTRPNLHNVERVDRLVNPFPIPARRCFGPEPGCVNYHLDYQGIQVRIATHHSGDPEFTRIFREGKDPHHAAAEEFYGERYTNLVFGSEEQKLKRGAAKNADFSVIFAGGLETTAKSLGLTRQEFEPGWHRYKNRFRKMAELNKKDSEEVRKTGRVVTTFGRILRVPRGDAYMGTNYHVQGDEAGVLKRAEIRVDNYLEAATGGEVGIILPVHDELIIRCPRDRIADFEGDCLPHIKELMEDFPMFSVPLEIEAEVSIRDWTSKKPVTIGGRVA